MAVFEEAQTVGFGSVGVETTPQLIALINRCLAGGPDAAGVGQERSRGCGPLVQLTPGSPPFRSDGQRPYSFEMTAKRWVEPGRRGDGWPGYLQLRFGVCIAGGLHGAPQLGE